jgi:hypothetical protein
MSPDEFAHRIAEANHRTALASFDADIQTSLEATKAANKSAADALRAVTLLNGGAAVAILAFIGHLASTQIDPKTFELLKRPLSYYVIGTFLSVVASAFTYFVHEGYIRALKYRFRKRELDQDKPVDNDAVRKAQRREMNSRRIAWTFKAIALICGLLALVAFGVGSYTAYRAFEHLNDLEPRTEGKGGGNEVMQQG